MISVVCCVASIGAGAAALHRRFYFVSIRLAATFRAAVIGSNAGIKASAL
jgi:hypothetical protein